MPSFSPGVSAKVWRFATAKIFVIEDDGLLGGLIEKALLANRLGAAGKDGRPAASLPGPEERGLGEPDLFLAEVVRKFLKAEMETGNRDRLHEAVIGKVERALIGMILKEEQGSQTHAAGRLGINRNTPRKRIKDLQIIISREVLLSRGDSAGGA